MMVNDENLERRNSHEESTSDSVVVDEISQKNEALVQSNESIIRAIERTNELLVMSLYIYLLFFLYFALHRFMQSKRRI